MPKQISYTLNENELKQIENAMQHDPRSEVVRRATAIHALHLGHKPEVVAQMVKAGKSTIGAWHRQWQSEGIDGLGYRPRSGRPPKANQTYQAALEKTLAQSPADYGYTFAVWTLDRLAEHLENETGIRLSIGRLQVWLERLGYVYRRPKRDLRHRQDPQARAEMQAWLEEIKKNAFAGMLELFFVDETTMTLDFPIRCCWMKRAQQMALPAAGKTRDYLHWIGAYNWLQDTIEALCVPRKTSSNFIRFLEYLLVQRVPDGPVVLVLDNASYHHAADVQACLSLFQDRVMVVWLPPYSPDLNPIERFWLFLKNEVCANCLYPSLPILQTAVEKLFASQNDPISRRFSLARDFR